MLVTCRLSRLTLSCALLRSGFAMADKQGSLTVPPGKLPHPRSGLPPTQWLAYFYEIELD